MVGRRFPTCLKNVYWSTPSLWLPEVIRFQGLKIYGNSLSDSAFHKEILEANYEKGTIELLKNLLGEGMTFIDIGAHVGFHILGSSKAGGTGRQSLFF